MRDLAAQLDEWRSEGLISAKQVGAIATFEKGRAASPPKVEGRAAPAAEAIGYVGAAVALGAVAILLGDRWDDLNVGGRLAVVGILTLILLGAALALRHNPAGPIQRLVSVLAIGALSGIAWLTGIVVTETTTWRGQDIALTVSLVVFALAAPLYRVRRRALPQLAALVSLLVLVGTVFARPAFAGSITWGALVAWAVGVAWVLLALGGWHRPEGLAILSGSAVAIVGAIVVAAPSEHHAFLWLGLATAVALVWRGVTLDQTLMVAVGAIGVLIFVPQIVLESFPEGSGAIVAMLVTGLLLVIFAVGIARGRRRDDTPSAKEVRP